MTQAPADFKITFQRRVLVSNETLDLRALPPAIPDAALIGIGTTSLWTLAGALRPKALVVLDRNRSAYVQNVWMCALLAEFDTPQALAQAMLARPGYTPGDATQVGAYDRGYFSEVCARVLPRVAERDPAVARAAVIEVAWRHAYWGTALSYFDWTLAQQLASQPGHLWRSADALAFARAVPVLCVHGDVRAEATVERAQAWLGGTPIGAFYWSNVPHYILPDPTLGPRWGFPGRWREGASALVGHVGSDGAMRVRAVPAAQFFERCRGPATMLLDADWRPPPVLKQGQEHPLWQAALNASFLPAELQAELLAEAERAAPLSAPEPPPSPPQGIDECTEGPVPLERFAGLGPDALVARLPSLDGDEAIATANVAAYLLGHYA